MDITPATSQTATPRTLHAHLNVSDLNRSIAFYRDTLGLAVDHHIGDQTARLTIGPDTIGIELDKDPDGSKGQKPLGGADRIDHIAVIYPDRASLAAAVRDVMEHGLPIDGAADHGVSEAIYLRDPDGHRVELYRDRSEAEWTNLTKYHEAWVNAPLDVQTLLAAHPS